MERNENHGHTCANGRKENGGVEFSNGLCGGFVGHGDGRVCVCVFVMREREEEESSGWVRKGGEEEGKGRRLWRRQRRNSGKGAEQGRNANK